VRTEELVRRTGKEVRADGADIERQVRRGMFAFVDSEVSGDELRFSAHALGLPDGEKALAILNPYAPDALQCFDAKGRYLGAAPRIWSIDRASTEAIMAECGAASRELAERLQPFRARHAAEARSKAADARHNAAVVSGEPVTPEAKALERRTQRRAAREQGTIEELTAAIEIIEPAPVEEDDDFSQLL